MQRWIAWKKHWNPIINARKHRHSGKKCQFISLINPDALFLRPAGEVAQVVRALDS